MKCVRHTLTNVITALGLVIGMAGTAQATLVSYNISGTITEVKDDDNLLDGSIIV